MRLLYYFLGAIAKVNSTLWRYRVNFIPLNLVGIFGLAAIGIKFWDNGVEALRNSETPLLVSLDQVHRQGIVQNYVKLSGLFVPIALYRSTSNGEKSWAPLFDVERKHVILVQRSGAIPKGEPHLIELTGMLKPISEDLLRKMRGYSNQIENIPIEMRYMLVDGASPSDARLAMIWAALTFFALGCVGIVALMRNIVFRSNGRVMVLPPSTAEISQPVKVRATGRFVLDAEDARRFINIPALLTMASGCPVLVSNINVTSRFMGIRTKERSGIWSLKMKPGTLRDGESGLLFFGLSCYPSIRLSYLDPESDSLQRAVISVDDPKSIGFVVPILAHGGLHL